MVEFMSVTNFDKLPRPHLPTVLTFESVQRYKESRRAYDLARIKAGLATPREIQRENEAVHDSNPVELQEFPELEPPHASLP